jgi:hypothetical protein
MRRNDPGLAHIEAALEEYALITEPHRATPAEATDRIAERLVTAGYAIRPRRGRLLPRGAARIHRITYAAAVASLTTALLVAWVQLWVPAGVCVIVSAFLADLAHRQHHARTLAVAAERAARPEAFQ